MKDIIYDGKTLKVIRQRFSAASAGIEKIIDYVEQPEVVCAIPVLPTGDLALVEHLRPILGTTLLECPGGKVDPGEDLETSILRELQEEIGYTCGELEYLSYFYTSVGSSTEKIHVFIARRLTDHVRKAEDEKKMNVRIITPDYAWELLQTNGLHDGKTEIALHRFFLTKNSH